MHWVYAILVVFAPAIIFVVFGLILRRYRRVCPCCKQRGLRMVNFIRATVHANGQRAPDSWAYFLCEKCAVYVKWHRNQWEAITEHDRPYLVDAFASGK